MIVFSSELLWFDPQGHRFYRFLHWHFTFLQTTDNFTSVLHVWMWGHILPEIFFFFYKKQVFLACCCCWCVSPNTVGVFTATDFNASGNCSDSTHKTTVWSHLLPGSHHSDSSGMVIHFCATPVVCAAFKVDSENGCTKDLLFLFSPHLSSSPLPKGKLFRVSGWIAFFSIWGSFWKFLHFRMQQSNSRQIHLNERHVWSQWSF